MTNDQGNAQILLAAYNLVNGARSQDYGDTMPCFERIAGLWGAYLGRAISSRDVGLMMALLKIAREAGKHKPDNLLDAAGYIGLAGDL